MDRRRLFLPCVIVLIICCVGIWWWCRYFDRCPWCPPCDDGGTGTTPECPDPVAELVVEDIHASVWMHIDNSGWIGSLPTDVDPDTEGNQGLCSDATAADREFYGDCLGSYAVPDEDYRPGLLFQLGRVLSDTGGSDYFEKIEVTFSDGSTLSFDENDDDDDGALGFDWLDINAAGYDCPIDAFHAYALFRNSIVRQECDPDLTDVVDAGTSTPHAMGDDCLRNRQIHSSMRPDFGAVTYWPGILSYYTMEASRSGHNHIRYVFGINEDVTLDHWHEGCFQGRYPDDLSDPSVTITEIRIHYADPSSTHNEFHDSPMNGGGITIP